MSPPGVPVRCSRLGHTLQQQQFQSPTQGPLISFNQLSNKELQMNRYSWHDICRGKLRIGNAAG